MTTTKTSKNLVVLLFIVLFAAPESDADLHGIIKDAKNIIEPVVRILDATAKDIGLKHPNVTSSLVNAGSDLGLVITSGKFNLKSLKRAVVDLNNVLKALDDGLDNLGPLKSVPPISAISAAVSAARVATLAAVTILNAIVDLFG